MRTIQLLAIFIVMSVSVILPNSEGDSDRFTFVRLQYGGQLTRRSSWRVDWPASDRNFIWQLRKQTNIDADPREKIIKVGETELFEYPFSYMLEVGSLRLNQSEAENLREYLLRGGFIFIDDFHGEREWRRFTRNSRKSFQSENRWISPYPIRFSDASSKSKNSSRFLGFARFLVDARMKDTMVILHTVAASMTTMAGL